MNCLSPRRVASLIVSLTILAIPLVVAAHRCTGMSHLPLAIGRAITEERTVMNRLSPRRVAVLLASLTILAVPLVILALAAAPMCPNCRWQ